MPNRLIHESSPYLLQHAHNPVDWYPYGDEAFAKASKENRPMLFSIGYSSCHWCHVMEHESFEDEEIAGLMNEHFVCVKVDREERPDIDHLYMDAVQLLHGYGGWPLNCFTLPDGRPFWGGTYFRPAQWKDLLTNISQLYQTQYADLLSQAEEVSSGIAGHNLISHSADAEIISQDDLNSLFSRLEQSFDRVNGGMTGSPKFPMPVILRFLLKYYHSFSYQPALEQVLLTLRKMAMGGIFDQVSGGFARYSVDNVWKVPHFEKMLYDNAQLVGLYADAYKITKDEFFKEIVERTLEFIRLEMTAHEGVFFSALDADSEGEEGLFYTWTRLEFEETIGPYGKLVAEYFGLGAEGEWENDRNILLRPTDDRLFAQRHFLSVEELSSLLKHSRSLLYEARSKRTRPGLDDKMLVSWNALMIKAYADAYNSLGNHEYLESALKAARFILNNLKCKDGGMFHTWKNGKSRIEAFLDDYALLGDAFLSLYKVTLDKNWLKESLELIQYAFDHLADPGSGLFFFSEKTQESIFRELETYDGVIPSSNSVFAHLMFILGTFTDSVKYMDTSREMVRILSERIINYPSSFAGWSNLAIEITKPFHVIAVVGDDAMAKVRLLNMNYLPDTIIAGSTVPSDLPYFKDRFVPGKTLIYICTGNTCLMPVETVDETLSLLANLK